MSYLKKIVYLFSILFFISQHTWAQYDVTVVFKGINQVKGDLYIGLYNQSEGFLAEDKTYRNTIIPITTTDMNWELLDLPAGDYAVTTFQDSNKNGKCDFSFFGFPTERFGFSLEPRLKFRAPYFEETSFRIEKNQKVIVYVKSFPEHLFRHADSEQQ